MNRHEASSYFIPLKRWMRDAFSFTFLLLYFSTLLFPAAYADPTHLTPEQKEILQNQGVLIHDVDSLLKGWPDFPFERMVELSAGGVPLLFFSDSAHQINNIVLTDHELIHLQKEAHGKLTSPHFRLFNLYKKLFPDIPLNSAKAHELLELYKKYSNLESALYFSYHYKNSDLEDLAKKTKGISFADSFLVVYPNIPLEKAIEILKGPGLIFHQWAELKKLKPHLKLDSLFEELSAFPHLQLQTVFNFWKANPDITLAQTSSFIKFSIFSLNDWPEAKDPQALLEKYENYEKAGLPIFLLSSIKRQHPKIPLDQIYDFWQFLKTKEVPTNLNSSLLPLVAYLSKEEAYDDLVNKKWSLPILEQIAVWGPEKVEELSKKCASVPNTSLTIFLSSLPRTPQALEFFCQFEIAHPGAGKFLFEIEEKFFPDAAKFYEAARPDQPNPDVVPLDVIGLRLSRFLTQTSIDSILANKNNLRTVDDFIKIEMILKNSNLSLSDVFHFLKQGLTIDDLKSLTFYIRGLNSKTGDFLTKGPRTIEELRQIYPFLESDKFKNLNFQNQIKILEVWREFNYDAKDLEIYVNIPWSPITPDQIKCFRAMSNFTRANFFDKNLNITSEDFSFLCRTLPYDYMGDISVYSIENIRDALKNRDSEKILNSAKDIYDSLKRDEMEEAKNDAKRKSRRFFGFKNPWETTEEALRTFYSIESAHKGLAGHISYPDWQRNPIEVLMQAGAVVQGLRLSSAPAVEPQFTKKMFISIAPPTEIPHLSAEMMEKIKAQLEQDLLTLKGYALQGSLIQDLILLKQQKADRKVYLAFLRLSPFLYSHHDEERFTWPLTESELIRKLTVDSLRNLYLGFFQNDLIPKILESPQLKNVRQYVDVVNKDWIEKTIQNKAVPFGKEEVVISGEEVPPGVSTLRGCLTGECSLFSAPFIGLHKDVKVFFLRKSHKWDARPDGYVLVLEVNRDNKTLPYILTVGVPQGGYSKQEANATLRMIADYYKSKTFLIPDQKNSLHQYFNNNNTVLKEIFSELIPKGTPSLGMTPPIHLPDLNRLAQYTDIIKRNLNNYYHPDNIINPVLVEVESLGSAVETSFYEGLSANPYLPPATTTEMLARMDPKEKEEFEKQASLYLSPDSPLKKQIDRVLGLDSSARSVAEFLKQIEKSGHPAFISDREMGEVITFLQDPQLVLKPQEEEALGALFWKKRWGKQEIPPFASPQAKEAFKNRIRKTLLSENKEKGEFDTLFLTSTRLAHLSSNVEKMIKILGEDFSVLRQDLVPPYLQLIERGIHSPHFHEESIGTSGFLNAIDQVIRYSAPEERGLLAKDLWDATRNFTGGIALQNLVDQKLKTLQQENPVPGPRPKDWGCGRNPDVIIPTDKLMVRTQEGGDCFAQTSSYLYDYYRFYIEGDSRTNAHSSALAGNIESIACQLDKGKVINNLSYFNPDLICPHFEQLKDKGACPRDILENKLDQAGKHGAVRQSIEDILKGYKTIGNENDLDPNTSKEQLICRLRPFSSEDEIARLKFYQEVRNIIDQSVGEKTHEGHFMQKLLNSICPPSQRLFINKAVSCRTETSDLSKRLDKYFSPTSPEPRLPMAAGICGNLLRKGKGFRGNEMDSQGCGPHGLMLTGRKKGLGNRCLIGVKTTWGAKCAGISKDWTCDSNGVIWIDQNDFLNNLRQLMVISR